MALKLSSQVGLRIGVQASGYAPVKGGGIRLPTVSSSPNIAQGTRKMVAGYSGPCCRVVRASDSSAQDIGFTASGVIDMAAANAFAVGSELTVSVWYDQSGNGNHSTQTTAASRPKLRPANSMRGLQGLTFDRAPTSLSIPSGVTFNTRANTGFIVNSWARGYVNNIPALLGSSGAGLGLYSSGVQSGVKLISGNVTNLQASKTGRYNPSINAFRSGASASHIYLDTSTFALAAGPASTGSGGTIGGNAGFSGFDAVGEFFALVNYPSALSDTEVSAVQSALRSIYGVDYSSSKLLVSKGNSITEGASSTYNQNYMRLVFEGLSSAPHTYNMGLSGTTAAVAYANRVAEWAQVDRSGMSKKVAVIALGINDIRAGTMASTIWTSYLLPLIQYVQSLGFTVIVSTVLPWNDAQFSSAKETERLALNSQIVSSAGSVGYTSVDYTALPEFDSTADANNTTYFSTDKLHPVNPGHALMAGLLTPVVEAALAA